MTRAIGPPSVRSGLLSRFAPGIGLVLVAALFYALAPDRPLSIGDARVILLHSTIVGLVALGMTVVIVSGGIDLSVGSAVALCGVVAAKAIGRGDAAVSPIWGVLAALGAGVACGVYNGLLISVLRLPPFIVTLGTLGFFRGLAKWMSSSSTVDCNAGWLATWVSPTPRGGLAWMLVAPVVWGLLLIAAITAAMLQATVAGRRAVAIGSNAEAARRAGIRTWRVKLFVYGVCGLLVGLAGVVQCARLGGVGDSTAQIGLELKAIAAVVIGGASLAGGSASVWGTLCGALLMSLLDNRCTALGWPNYVQELVVGHIIIVAVAADQWRRRRAGSVAA